MRWANSQKSIARPLGASVIDEDEMDGLRLAFTIPGPPVAWQRAGRGKFGHSYTQPRTATYQAKARHYARQELGAGAKPADGELALFVRFYMPTARRVDVDNLCKTVMDALNGVVWVDDSQVCELYASRFMDRAAPRAEIRVERR